MIYLDHNATSPLLPQVRDAMLPWLGVPANPASAHRAGQAAAVAVEEAREHIARLVGGNPAGVVLTSGATEANHLFVRGQARRTDRRCWLVSPIEHPCVLAATASLIERGFTVETLQVGPDGVCRLPLEPGPDLAGLSLMAANHETGCLQPLAQALTWIRGSGAALHIDATQAAGRVALDLGDADGVVLSGHKLGGPAGTGALILRDGEPFPALFTGGAQERGRRAGTVNVAGAVGLGEACRLALETLEERQALWRSLMHDLRVGLTALDGRIVAEAAPHVGQTTCVVFAGLRAETLVQALDVRGICVSAGAACSSGSVQASPVLTAMGDPEPAGGLRISLGPTSTAQDVAALLQALPEVLETVRWAQDLDLDGSGLENG